MSRRVYSNVASTAAPHKLLDTEGVTIGPKGTAEIATYPSLTEWRGHRMLWYPDRKFYLLGKHLPDSLLTTIDPDQVCS